MRNWNDVMFYRPTRQARYRHVDALFGGVIDWALIEDHHRDMMQVILSIQAGTVLPSMLLRKLGSHNRRNRLSKAFRELGRVVRTLFLLRYISDNFPLYCPYSVCRSVLDAILKSGIGLPSFSDLGFSRHSRMDSNVSLAA